MCCCLLCKHAVACHSQAVLYVCVLVCEAISPVSLNRFRQLVRNRTTGLLVFLYSHICIPLLSYLCFFALIFVFIYNHICINLQSYLYSFTIIFVFLCYHICIPLLSYLYSFALIFVFVFGPKQAFFSNVIKVQPLIANMENMGKYL